MGKNTAPDRRDGLHLYRAVDGWRWRLLRHGRVVAEAGEPYTRRDRCLEQAFAAANPAAFDWLHEDDKGTTRRLPPARPGGRVAALTQPSLG